MAAWYNCDDAKEGKIDLDTKLRTLVLTDVDFNHNNKILGSHTLQHSEKISSGK